jgi:hypothetical protein
LVNAVASVIIVVPSSEQAVPGAISSTVVGVVASFDSVRPPR